MKLLIAVTRTLVGILFIFSGLVKADDPLGLSYKMQEFFEVWNFHWFDHVTLAFSILMIVFEIVAGVALLLGWRIRLFSWLLLLLIIFFTFLTGYAYLSGKVRECGCFGNCIPLTAGQSFMKDLVLTVLIIFLFIVRDRIKPLLPPRLSAALLTAAAIFSFLFQWYVLVHLPVVDCLPYRIGASIPDQMKPPPGAIPDSTVITMVYEKAGKRIEFDATHFPADFSDSYHFVSRYDKLVRKGNAEPAIKDFILTTAADVDTTEAVLGAKGYKLFEFVENVNDYTATREFSIILTLAKAKNIPLYIITADYDGVMNRVAQIGIAANVIVLKCDGTAVKTAARANPTLLLLKKGIIIGKWSYADFDRALPAISALANDQAP
ncbi:MAG TPA: BT_3928 family protein [Puia sp.]|nr:BT_3928 family protein [Puia sp.]